MPDDPMARYQLSMLISVLFATLPLISSAYTFSLSLKGWRHGLLALRALVEAAMSIAVYVLAFTPPQSSVEEIRRGILLTMGGLAILGLNQRIWWKGLEKAWKTHPVMMWMGGIIALINAGILLAAIIYG